ncbi:MAG TPA: lamin tail domain-containing protein, partial [Verrucomicrobiae bacterium]|nr:lamin tail domain-containing protein [Verrucomicrobiae bacterium]
MKTTLFMRHALAVLAVCLFGFSASAQVYINEVLADNQAAYNVDGDFPDYVELINTNKTASANISSWRLSIDVSKPNDYNYTYIFPANSVIPPSGFLLVICDGNTNQRYHTKFNIGKKGETLTLLGAQLGLRDSVRFGFQVTDSSMGRVPDGPPGVHVLCRPTPGAVNVQVPLGNRARIRFNEWMPSRGTADDWFEIYNPETNAVALSGLVFSDRTNTLTQCTNKVTVTNSWMAAGGFLQFFCDDHGEQGNDQLDFKLTSLGEAANPPEHLTLFAANKQSVIHSAYWTNAALDVSYGYLPDGNTNDPVVTFPVSRDTPGDSNFLPIDNVLINEVLTHTDMPLEDAVELWNPTDQFVDISGWWLSDDKDTYNKFRIPNGTILAPYGYKTFYEYLGEPGGFNPNGQGIFPSFSFSSSQGDQCYLFSTYPGTTRLDGHRRGVDFPASENGVSFGRYVTSTGESDFVPMETLTFGSNVTRTDPTNRLDDFRAGLGATNSRPKFGPIVITEIMYHPPDFIQDVTNIVKNELDEYVEIYNMTTQRVKLWDTNVYDYPPFGHAYTNTWHLRGQIDFNFPTNISLAPGESLIVVNFGLTNTIQLNTFRAKFHIPPTVQIFGAYGGKLSDGGGTFQIERPDAPQNPALHPDEAGFVPYLRVDKVRYDDDPPWPAEADGVALDPANPNSVGYCLVRKIPEEYGADVINWYAAAPSPGYQSISNSVAIVGSSVAINFQGLAGSGYTIQYKDRLEDATWQKLQDFQPQTATGTR